MRRLFCRLLALMTVLCLMTVTAYAGPRSSEELPGVLSIDTLPIGDFGLLEIEGELFKLPMYAQTLEDAGWECDERQGLIVRYDVEVENDERYETGYSRNDKSISVGAYNNAGMKTEFNNCRVEKIAMECGKVSAWLTLNGFPLKLGETTKSEIEALYNGTDRLGEYPAVRMKDGWQWQLSWGSPYLNAGFDTVMISLEFDADEKLGKIVYEIAATGAPTADAYLRKEEPEEEQSETVLPDPVEETETVSQEPIEEPETVIPEPVETEVVEPTEPIITVHIAKGDKGDDVKQLQQKLIDLGYLSGKADGDFGKGTEAAVIKAQQAYGLEENGIADNALMARLAAEALAGMKAGDIMTYGNYWQSGDEKEPIEWIVLEVDGDKALLLSKYCLQDLSYDLKAQYKAEGTTWEESTLRESLNGWLMNDMFTPEEQGSILLTHVDNSTDQGYVGWLTDGGNDTDDKLFLLSYAEANKYLGAVYDEDYNGVMTSRAAPTEWAKSFGAYTAKIFGDPSIDNVTEEGEPATFWWLRSPGDSQWHVAQVDCNGNISGSRDANASNAIRPAMWIDLSALQ